MHTSSPRTTPRSVMRDYLSIYLEQEAEGREHVERAVERSFKVRCTRASALSPRMRDTKLSRRFGTVRFVYRSGMAHAATRKRDREGERERSKENGTVSRSKCMRTRGDNANARRALSFSLLLSSLFLSRSFRLSLLLFFIFSPIRINVLMRSRAETRG